MQVNKIVIRCKNCANIFSGHYCSHCGQDAHTGKIDSHFLIHEIQHGLLHVDKGILYTIKELFIRPGHALRAFIGGKRVKHFKPLSFLIIIAGLDAFVNHYLHLSALVPAAAKNKHVDGLIGIVNEWSAKHYILLMLLHLPLLSYVFYLFFRKYKMGYLEHLVINCYLSGQKILIRLLLLPLLYLNIGWSIVNNVVIPIGFTIWTYTQFYQKEPRFSILSRATIAYAVFYFLEIVLLSIVLTVLDSVSVL
jgi:hypothetical protein